MTTLIYNPDAGRSARWAQALLPTADPLGWLETARDVVQPQLVSEARTFLDARAAAHRAVAAGATRVVVAGGDGTVRAVAGALAGTGVALGIVPMGTVNVLARELQIPLDDLEAALAISAGTVARPIDLGVVNDDWFLLNCSAGFDAQTVAQVSEPLKNVVGATAYAAAALGVLPTFVPPRFRLVLDGSVRVDQEAFLVVIANTSSYGGDLKLFPDGALDDGWLDIAVFEAAPGLAPVRAAAFLRQLSAVALGRHAEDDEIHFYRARHIEIHAEPATPAQSDGDPHGETPLSIAVRPGALTVLSAATVA